MEKARNIVFVVVITALLFFGVIGNTAVNELVPGIDAPTRSQLEWRPLYTVDDLAGKSVFDKEFQDSFETFAADHLPMRDGLVLLSASLQRFGIATSAAVMGYSMYPTYFDSNHAVAPEQDYLFQTVESIPRDTDKLDALVDTINDVARKHPDVRFFVAQVPTPQDMDVNPTRDLVTRRQTVDVDWIRENFIDRLDESIGTYLEDCDSLDELMEGWFSADVHWNLKRAFNTYNKVAEALDLEPAVWDTSKEVLVSKAWEGTTARIGRDIDVSSTLVDQADDFSMLHYYKLTEKGPGESFDPGMRSEVLAHDGDKTELLSMYAAYSQYYGEGVPAYVVNEGENNGKTCLLVGDSYCYCAKNYFARNYAETIVIYPGNTKTKHTFNWYVKNFDVDDVIVLTNPMKYQPIAETSPAFVGYKSE